MFGIGFQELLVILIVALIVLEPERLPEVAKSLGKFYRELKSTIDDVKSSLATDLKSVKEIECDIRSDISKLEETVLEEPIEIDKDFEKEFEKEIKRMKVNECCKKEQIIDY